MNRVINNFIVWLLRLRVVRKFKLQTTPRWVILLIDMLIVMVSFALVVTADTFVNRQLYASPLQVLAALAVVVATYFGVTYVSKSYTCVIRLSVTEDLFRTFLVAFMATTILIAINTGVHFVTGQQMFRYWSVLLVGALAFSIMTIERLLIKYLYQRLSAESDGRRRVLVLGTSLESLILANALKNEIGGRYEPVGLLTMRPERGGQTINGFHVYAYNEQTTADVFVEHGIFALIFNVSNRDRIRAVADYFLHNNITLLQINREEEFDMESLHNDSVSVSSSVREVQIEDLLGREPIVLDNPLVSNTIRGSVVLITGACGSIGSEIVRQVAAYKAGKIVLVDQAETPMHDLSVEMRKSYPDAEVVLFMGDVQNYARMEVAFRTYHPRFVFHAAAYKHVPMMEINPTEAVMTNVMGTKHIADLSLKYGVYKFVMISTDKAVNPTNVMGCTKRLAEIYCQSLFFDATRRGLSTQFITTRFGNVLGSNGSVIPLFRRQIASGGPVTVTHKEIIRYFMTIPEACSLVLEAGSMGQGGEIYIFDMGQPVKIYDLAVRMISLAGLRPNVDIQIEEVGLRPGEKLYEELLNDKERTTATTNKKIMIAKVRTYDYRDVCEHIGRIIDWAEKGNVHHTVYAMKRFVPEYKSQQSEAFEAIDREIEQEKPLQPQTEPERYY